MHDTPSLEISICAVCVEETPDVRSHLFCLSDLKKQTTQHVRKGCLAEDTLTLSMVVEGRRSKLLLYRSIVQTSIKLPKN